MLWQNKKKTELRDLQLSMESEYITKIRTIESTWERRLADARMKNELEVSTIKMQNKDEINALKSEFSWGTCCWSASC